MFNSREMLDLINDHQREIRDQVTLDRLASESVVEQPPRYAALLASLGGTLISVGEALQHRYAGLREKVATAELPAVDDGLGLRA
jgi:hypothetical protein